MTAPEWDRLKDAFADLVDLPAGERRVRLERLASTDPDLHRRLDALLDADARAAAVLNHFELASAASWDDDVAGASAAERVSGAELSDPFGLAGRVVSHFRIHDVLGCGGMGVVYRAEDVRLGRVVALKFLLPQYALDPAAKDRFLHEARAASTLDHPNVCTVYESGVSEDGRLFMAMACYGGETLKQRLARGGPLPLDEIARITTALLAALGAAHAAGIVHRDLKPGNVILTDDGAVKILDFGLAKIRDLTITASGQRPGTAPYMSPEQIEGADVDQRSDLWSLGIVLYEMLAGRHPFAGAHELSALYAIVNQDPAPPSRFRSDVGTGWDALVAALLRKNPAERFATAEDVLAALRAVESGQMTSHGSVTPPILTAARRRRLASRGRFAVLITLGVIGATIGARIVRDRTVARTASVASTVAEFGGERASIAILPFADLSPNGDQEYFSDGVAEEILNAVARLPGVRVPARTSSFSFKASKLPAREIADRLGVATVLEGSVRRSGDRVRIDVRLIDARADRQVWSRTFDRDMKDIFAVQSEIASTVAGALQLRLDRTATAAAPPTASADAHDLYLKGRFHLNRRTAGDLGQAIRYFEAAARIDSSYARAWAGIALAYAVLPISNSDVSASDALGHVERAAAAAIAIDSGLAEAHAALGYAYHWNWRWKDADREFRRALALDSTDVTSLQWYGEHAAKMGQFDASEALLRRALSLDPLSVIVNNNVGLVLMLARRYPEAIAQLERTHRMDSTLAIPMFLLHRSYLLEGDVESAARTGRLAYGMGPEDPADFAVLAYAIRDPARRPEALAILARWERQRIPRWADLALYYTMLGQREAALTALERGFTARTAMLSQIKVAPWLDPLRSEPRFRRIMEAMQLE